MYNDKDYFEKYLESFPDVPSLVLVRSVELKNFPREFLKLPILDLCCGDGFFSAALGLKDIYGCDISEKAIQLAQEKGVYSDLKICDICKLPYEDNSFNSILCNCALEHIEKVNIALLEVSRALTSGGYLIMTVPSELLLNSFPSKKFFESIGMRKLGEKLLDIYNKKQSHRNIFSIEQWEDLLSYSRFKIIKKFYFFNESSYKIAMFYDWLLTLSPFNIANSFLKLIFPEGARKAFWRRLLMKYYLSSTPLENGGELVIIAKNEK